MKLAQKACVMNENELISLADFRRRLRDRTGIEFHHSTVRRWHRAGRIPQGARIGAWAGRQHGGANGRCGRQSISHTRYIEAAEGA